MAQWGDTVQGKKAVLMTLKSEALEVDVTNFGATLVSVRVKVDGQWLDVLLGYESLERYVNGGEANLSSAVGRCGNRIAGGTFEIDGTTYTLDKNDGPNHIHGGTEGFCKQVFDVVSSTETSVTLALTEPDGAMGYPGTVDIQVTYEVKGKELHFIYGGKTDKPTLVNMTNHGYWNLKGHGAGNVFDHKLMVAGSKTTAVDEALIINGELLPVDGTSYDLRKEPRLLQAAKDEGGPFDVNYCLDKPEGTAEGQPAFAARLIAPGGLVMDVWTDQPGLQCYTSNFIHDAPKWKGKGASYEQFGAICLEPQLWPDGIHHKHFPSPILRPGETYKHHSYHIFTAP